MRAVVAGSRYQRDREFVWRVMDRLREVYGIKSVAQGGASGTDDLVKQWAEARGVPCRTYHANWDKHGRSAGPRRNAEMLMSEQPQVVVAFPGGPGTRDLAQRAEHVRPKPVVVHVDRCEGEGR